MRLASAAKARYSVTRISFGNATRSGMKPSNLRAARGLRATSASPMRIEPASHAAIPAMQVIRLDLPAPFGPSSPVMPGPSVNDTSSTAIRAP